MATKSKPKKNTKTKKKNPDSKHRGNIPSVCPDKPKAKHAGGRPTRLTEELIEEWANLQKNSFYNDTILCMLDISRDNVKVWRKRGKKEFDRLQIDDQVLPLPEEELYLKFYLTLRKAMARKEINCIKAIMKAGRSPQYWTAMAWLLERTMPEKYGNKNQEIKEMKRMLEDVCKKLNQKETEEMIDEALEKKSEQDRKKAEKQEESEEKE